MSKIWHSSVGYELEPEDQLFELRFLIVFLWSLQANVTRPE
jgi:hypothetical protein